MNVNANWQKQCDDFTKLNLHLATVSHEKNGLLTATAVKMVDNVLFGAENAGTDKRQQNDQ